MLLQNNEMIISIIGAIIAIFIVVLIHEMGHFYVARLCGIKVLKFSIGFGKAFWSYTSKKTGTVYALGIFPLGGYVKMYGETTEEKLDPELAAQSYAHKSVWARMAVALAGPAANIVLALVAFWVVYMCGIIYQKPIIGRVYPQTIAARAGLESGEQIIRIGQQKVYGWRQVVMSMLSHIGDSDLVTVVTRRNGVQKRHQLDLSQWRIQKRDPRILKSLGLEPKFATIDPVIRRVMAGSPAAVAGLHSGDRVVSINNQPITRWMQVLTIIEHAPAKTIAMTVKRDGVLQRLSVKLGKSERNHQSVGHLGVEVAVPPIPKSMLDTVQYGFFESMMHSGDRTWRMFMLNGQILVKMFTGNVSMNTLGGPISVFRTAGMASQAGFVIYLSFIGFISIALGFINLLPIPLLDGGHVLFQLIEAIARRPVPQRYQIIGLKLGIVLLLWVMVQATVNDVLRIFS